MESKFLDQDVDVVSLALINVPPVSLCLNC